MANKLGTLAEDLVALSIPRVVRTVLGCSQEQIDSSAVRVRRRSQADPSRHQEFDVVVACGPYLLVNETKSSLNTELIRAFVSLLPAVRDYFPEHADRRSSALSPPSTWTTACAAMPRSRGRLCWASARM